MQLEDFFDFIGDPVEAILLKGTRIDLEYVVGLYERHMTAEQIAVHFASPLKLVLVYAAITYYLGNRAEVEGYLAHRKEMGEANFRAYLALPESPVARRIRDVKARLANGGPFTDEELASDSFRRLRSYWDSRRQEAPADQVITAAPNGAVGHPVTQPRSSASVASDSY